MTICKQQFESFVYNYAVSKQFIKFSQQVKFIKNYFDQFKQMLFFLKINNVYNLQTKTRHFRVPGSSNTFAHNLLESKGHILYNIAIYHLPCNLGG